MKDKTTICIGIIVLLLSSSFANCQGFIDTVYSYRWGSGSQQVGRATEYFPQNIFGTPVSTATQYSPAFADEDVCSLGLSGEIVVGKAGYYIVDRPGVDFIIFENVFATLNGAKVFAEPAIVSVSKDGITYYDFPYNAETLDGLAGVNWTNGDANPFDYPASGGDGFDLATLGIDSICYIKIHDTAVLAAALPPSDKYYSPKALLTGFDLDAVALVHISPIGNDEQLLTISNTQGTITLSPNQVGVKVWLSDIQGNTLLQRTLDAPYILSKRYRNIPLLLKAERQGITQNYKIMSIE